MIPGRLKWMAVGAGVSYLSKKKAERSVDRATEQLQEKLPAPLVSVAERLPADVVRAGGAVVAAGEAAKTAAVVAKGAAGVTGTALSVGRSASQAARQASAVVSDTRRSMSDRLARTAGDLRAQTELDRRELKSEYIRHTEGDGPALEALLDLRDEPSDELPSVPDPVAEGRRRFRKTLPPAPVARVQRSYRPASKPWD